MGDLEAEIEAYKGELLASKGKRVSKLEVDKLHSLEKLYSKFERIKITKIAQLDKSNFYYGIKIDNELLREHFRTYNV